MLNTNFCKILTFLFTPIYFWSLGSLKTFRVSQEMQFNVSFERKIFKFRFYFKEVNNYLKLKKRNKVIIYNVLANKPSIIINNK